VAQDEQIELFGLDDVEGYAALTPRERRFAAALMSGATQREAAAAAGIIGQEGAIDVQAHRIVQRPKFQRVMNQAWARAGASIDTTLRQAAELQQQSFLEATTSANRANRLEAFRKWKDASTLIASIHGKLQLKVDTTVTHLAGPGMVLIPEAALAGFAEMRRTTELEVTEQGRLS
jgi:hypothetical protein